MGACEVHVAHTEVPAHTEVCSIQQVDVIRLINDLERAYGLLAMCMIKTFKVLINSSVVI